MRRTLFDEPQTIGGALINLDFGSGDTPLVPMRTPLLSYIAYHKQA